MIGRNFLGILLTIQHMMELFMSHHAAPPKPQNQMTPDEALTRLLAGNERYVQGIDSPDCFSAQAQELADSQNPYACILGCADSRVSPEHCFEEGQGDLFVTRIAGNFVTQEILGSLEYGTAVLGASLILVLGHTGCGAIGAAIKAVHDDEDFPGHIQGIATALSASVLKAVEDHPEDDLHFQATRLNVIANVKRLRDATPVLRRRVREGQLRIVGAMYHLETGRVEVVDH